MKLQIVCLRDIKTDDHTTPQFVPHVESWRRALGDAINKPDQNAAQMDFVKHPEDFEAYKLGEWDSNTADWEINTKERLFILEELIITKQ